MRGEGLSTPDRTPVQRPAFEVLRAFEPLARLVKRSPSLDGAVPLRVAQACAPMLEGNAAGVQVVFDTRLVVGSRLGRRRLEASAALDAVDRAQRAAIPLLAARGLLEPGGAWHARLARSWWWSEGGVLRVWTGLLVRPRADVWLRVSAAKNRGVVSARIRTAWIARGEADDAGGGWTPLVVDVEAASDGARLEGEVATVLPAAPGARLARATDAEARALAEAHASFYDARYFATKRRAPTRKYRRLFARERPGREVAPEGDVVVAELAGPAAELARVERVLGPRSVLPHALPARARAVELLRFRHAVSLRADFDGNVLDVTPDRAVLGEGARAVRASLARLLGDGWSAAHEGAVLYLTKYVTPHPRGEPHFFVKPWAFVRTPAGWSSVVDGISGEGYEILRGVVRTDGFHAVPAVFQVPPGRRVRVAAGAPMLEVVPVPRALLEAPFTERSET